MDVMRIEGHTRRPNRLKTLHATRTTLEAHISVTQRKHNETSAPQGSFEPTLSRLILGLPRGASLLILRVVPRCFVVSWCSDPRCPWPINRRGRSSFLRHHSWFTSLL
jgi:hypothetical protein